MKTDYIKDKDQEKYKTLNYKSSESLWEKTTVRKLEKNPILKQPRLIHQERNLLRLKDFVAKGK